MRAALVGTTIVAASCTATAPSEPFRQDHRELIAAFKAETEAVQKRREARVKAAILKLEVTQVVTNAGMTFLVTADLDAASVAVVVKRLLDETGVAFNLMDVNLGGSATVRFEQLELSEALNQILSVQGVAATWRSGILIFGYAPTEPNNAVGNTSGSSADVVEDDVHYEVVLNNLSAEDALDLLESVYSDRDELSYGSVPNVNTIYLAGERATVAAARSVIVRADKQVPHVFIETTVVDLDTLATLSLGARLTDGASGDFSGINILPGTSSGTLGFSLIEGLQSPAQLTLMIDLLTSEDSAEVLSRPYIATRSHQQATIEITTEQYVAVQRSIDGAAITTTEGVTAGTKLEVTPVVQANGLIRLDLSVEQSEFLPAVAGSLIQLERNTASTSVSVESGRTIAIGGLNFSNRLSTNAGIPGLRHVPGLNLATARQGEQQVGRELVVYITPRIWEPELETPLIRPDLPKRKRARSLDSTKAHDLELN